MWAMCHMDSLQTVCQLASEPCVGDVTRGICVGNVSRGLSVGNVTWAECGQCHMGSVWAMCHVVRVLTMSRGQCGQCVTCTGSASRNIDTIPSMRLVNASRNANDHVGGRYWCLVTSLANNEQTVATESAKSAKLLVTQKQRAKRHLR